VKMVTLAQAVMGEDETYLVADGKWPVRDENQRAIHSV